MSMPRAYASQFRAMVIEQVRSGKGVAEVAESVEVPQATVFLMPVTRSNP